MFSDIEGFTTISEQLSPNALAVALGAYLEAMTREIHATGGIIDKYTGDGVMALWNTPRRCEHHRRARLRRRTRMSRGDRGALRQRRLATARTVDHAVRHPSSRGDGWTFRLPRSHELHRDGRRGQPGLATRRLEQAVRDSDSRQCRRRGRGARRLSFSPPRPRCRQGKHEGVEIFELLGARDGVTQHPSASSVTSVPLRRISRSASTRHSLYSTAAPEIGRARCSPRVAGAFSPSRRRPAGTASTRLARSEKPPSAGRFSRRRTRPSAAIRT